MLQDRMMPAAAGGEHARQGITRPARQRALKPMAHVRHALQNALAGRGVLCYGRRPPDLGSAGRGQGEVAMASAGYTGDVTSTEAWEVLSRDPAAVLVDVRTNAEWAFVGLPDLSGLGKSPLLVEWQNFPAMQLNSDFAEEIVAKGVSREQTVFLICRSGQRSRQAAMALCAAGYGRCYNVSDGFEGRHDAERHRGITEGWKAAGLPWTQG
jgi:rhodanese-related sulfurtransferase